MFALNPRNHPPVVDAAPIHAAPFDLAAETRTFASQLYADVSAHYLEFRRVYYHEDTPALDTLPPRHAEIHRAEIALLAENTLRLIPPAVKSVPVIGGLFEHLERVANLHSISETERSALHNMTLAFLHGTQDGIQPWYAQWLLTSAQNLAGVTDTDYFITFPWDACLYMFPGELAAFERALQQNDTASIEHAVKGVADRLIRALRDPMEAQVAFAFTGPDAERRRVAFQLKTTAALALGAYLVTEEVRHLLHPRQPAQATQSVLAPFPPQLETQASEDSGDERVVR